METRILDQIKPIQFASKLAGTPKNHPKHLKKIKNLAGQEVELADPRAVRALVALMNQHAVIGGAAAHWGGPSAFAEIMSALHGHFFQDQSKPWYETFNFINDAGHCENGLYALRSLYGFDGLKNDDLQLFRSIESKLTGHGESHLNPEGVLISNGPLGSGLPQAQGLALADKLLRNQRLTVCTISDGAAMEGEAKESFSAIPGLAAKGQLNPFLMIISDNNTKLSGRIDEDSFAMANNFQALKEMGWELIVEKDGHNLQQVYLQIEKAFLQLKQNPTKPVALVFKTIKGKGVKSTETSKSGGHGYPLKPYDLNLVNFIDEIYSGDAPAEYLDWAQEILESKLDGEKKPAAAIPSEKVQVGLSKAAIKACKDGLPLFSVSADLAGSTGVAEFQKAFPQRWVDVGVAEANMISTAIGLSKSGFIPLVDTFAQFGVTKGNLPLTMATLSQAPVIALFSHTGFQDAADGASHQATTYFSATCSIPYTKVLSVSNSSEAEFFLTEAIKRFSEAKKLQKDQFNYVFFYGRENFPSYYEGIQYQWGKSPVLAKGKDVVIVATGPTVQQALKAQDMLAQEGVQASVVNNIFVSEPDVDTLLPLLEKAQGRLLTVEDHQVKAGMGAILTHALAQKGIPLKVISLGIKDHFGQSAYQAQELYQKYGLSASHIARSCEDLMRRR
jgi:transketolase